MTPARFTALLLLGAAGFAAVAMLHEAKAEMYWTAGLPNFEGYYSTQVSVTNIDATPLAATLNNGATGAPVDAMVVVPGSSGLFHYPEQLEGTQITYVGIYYVDTPLSRAEVAQFTLSTSVAASTDASRLIPESELGFDYGIATWEDPTAYLDPQPDYFTVIGTKAGTTVTVWVSATTSASLTSVPAVPAMTAAGSPYTFTLNRGQALHVESTSGGITCFIALLIPCPPGDLTGSRVSSTSPVAVFAGAQCVGMNDSSCDAISDQMLPSSRAGKTYIVCAAAMSTWPGSVSGTGQMDMLRLRALAGTTTVSFNVAVRGSYWAAPTITSATLTTSWSTFYTARDTVITAPDPVWVAQYMATSNVPPASGALLGIYGNFGDPALVMLQAIDLAYKEHAFYAPNTWENHLYVGAPVAAAFSVDGLSILGGWRVIGTSGYECFTPLLDGGASPSGTHYVVGGVPVVAQVLGNGPSTTYWYDTGPGKPPPPGPCLVDCVVVGTPLPVKVGTDFSWDANSLGCGKRYVSFADTSLAPPGETVTAWFWDFGDGWTSDEQFPYHAYDTDGDYTVTLTVTTSDGHMGTATHIVHGYGWVPCPTDAVRPLPPPGPEGPPRDGIDDALATGDRDGDGVLDAADNCPTTSNHDQDDLDGDGAGDVCDDDRDGDGVPDVADVCRDVPDPVQGDMDGDGTGDVCDGDRDGDGIANTDDPCPDAPGATICLAAPLQGGTGAVGAEATRDGSAAQVQGRATSWAPLLVAAGVAVAACAGTVVVAARRRHG